MYLILDLHAAPGGQGRDANISDDDPAKSSRWEREENRRQDVSNRPIWDLYKAITRAIRDVDTAHLVIVEGIGWAITAAGFLIHGTATW
jgi:hypothetical protein